MKSISAIFMFDNNELYR